MAAPKTQFVARAGAHLAYQVFGDGPNVLLINGLAQHIEQLWQWPIAIRGNERLARLARVALYDLRGWGMSDPLPPGGYPIEELAADALAVMDAAGFERAVAYGDTMGGAIAIWLAVHHPERFTKLIVGDAYACRRAAPDWDLGLTETEIQERREAIGAFWGTGATMAFFAPSLMDDERLREEWARYERMAATPNAAMLGYDLGVSIDVRDLLAKVAVPTLVMHSASNGLIPVEHGRYLAEHIPGARYFEVPDDPALEWTMSGIGAEIAEFLTGNRTNGYVERSLQVVLFADIAASTDRAVALGDTAWHDVLDDFRRAVRGVLERYDAREVNTRGDDFFAVAASPSVAVDVARAIRDATSQLDLQVRCGIHLGEVEHQGDDFAGLAVHIGARVAALAEPGEILVSQTVRDALVGSPVELVSRGVQALKGVPGEWQLFAVGG